MSENKQKRKKHGHADKHITLRVRRISALLGGVLILSAATFWFTGMFALSGSDTGTNSYTGKNPMMDPVLVDPALNTPAAVESSSESGETMPAAVESSSESGETMPAAVEPSSESGEPLSAAAKVSSESGETILEDGVLPASSDWLELRIQNYLGAIDKQDLSDFQRIIQYLDQGYIGGLAVDGLNSTERDLLQNHLNNRLSSSDYVRCKELFTIYEDLLNEE